MDSILNDPYIPLIGNSRLSKKYRKMLSKPSFTHVGHKLKDDIIEFLDSVDDEKLVTADSIVNQLRRAHSFYNRKKRTSFKLEVIKTYNAINNERKSVIEVLRAESEQKEATNRDDDELSESDFSEDHDDYVDYDDNRVLNSSLCDLYKKPTPLKRKMVSKDDNKPVEQPLNEREHEHDSTPVVIETTVSSVSKKRKLKGTSSTPKESGLYKLEPTTKKAEIIPEKTEVTFADIGGNEKCLEEVCEMLLPWKHPDICTELGAKPPTGLLLHGPPGCGKTLLAHAIAGELQVPFIKVASTEIVAGVSGESEEKIRDLFGKSVSSAPCVLFIDEIDAITPKRETAQREMERRIVTELMSCMDGLNWKNAAAQVLVIGATNRPDSIDPALRRPGRFDREICMGIPDEAARIRILKVLCRELKVDPELDLAYIAHNTPGYVGADLMALTRESTNRAILRIIRALHDEKLTNKDDNPVSDNSTQTNMSLNSNPTTSLDIALSWLRELPSITEQQRNDFFIEMSDFKLAMEIVQPSSKREGFATVPDVTWEDIGALSDVRRRLQLSILAPVRHRKQFQSLGLSNPAGILLCGPPGCGKTLLAKAVANESGVNFISVKGPELLNMYVGESERAVRQCFQRARNSSPCVIFFDELDALCPKRSESAEGSAGSRVVNQLLTEMDGMDSRKDVYILGATNRPDVIDPAILRPGRFDKVIYVGLPMAEDRLDILKALTKNETKPVFEKDVCLRNIATDKRCNGFTGADLLALLREASEAALEESIISSKSEDEEIKVGKRHFEAAFGTVRLSVSPEGRKMYEKMRRDFTKVIDTPH